MNYHIVMGLLGSGQGTLSKELRNTLAESTGNNDSAALVRWGAWESWQPTSSSYWPVGRVITRCQELAQANPLLDDVVIQGPWALDHWASFSEFPGSVTLYWVDRVQHHECRSKSLNYWTSTVSLQTRHTQSEYVTWLDQQEQLWADVVSTRTLEWSTWRTFVWDQDLNSVVVVPAASELSYLKQVAIDHFK